MINKKGFTLIEILAVIVLISLILGLGIPAVMKLSENSKKRTLNTKINLIEQAALNWGNDNKTLLKKDTCVIEETNYDCYKISVENLIEEDYLNSDKVGEVIYTDPTDNSSMTDKCVYVYKKNNRVYTKYSDTECEKNEEEQITVEIPDVCKDVPYSENVSTLAYNIICNAKLAEEEESTNRTVYRNTPLTNIAKVTEGYKNEVKISEEIVTSDISSYVDKYWTYGLSYSLNTSNGTFNITDISTCKYSDSDCLTALVKSDKTVYIKSTNGYSNSSSTNTQQSMTKLYYIYQLVDATYNKDGKSVIKTKLITGVPYSLESTLSISEDDYGTSYYYRGGVIDNFLNFNGMCWRIVRIQGDGSIKIVLEDQDEACSQNMDSNFNLGEVVFGDDNSMVNSDGKNIDVLNYLSPVGSTETSLVDVFKSFQDEKLATVTNKLKSGDWCLDDSAYDSNKTKITDVQPFYYENLTIRYGALNRLAYLKTATLKCEGTILTKFADETDMYVATLSADEVAYTGSAWNTRNSTNYLFDNNTSVWWTLSPSSFTDNPGNIHILWVDAGGISCIACDADYKWGSRPAIILKNGTLLKSGDGTISNPYIIQ